MTYMALTALVGCLMIATVSSSFLLADEKRLNVVFILADDLGWGELGCYGQQKIPTPNLDRLASQGVRFSQHYSGAPVCAPSRCVLMTGKHLGNAEIRGNLQAKVHFPEFAEGQMPLSESALTIAQLFQRAGYATGAMGKWGLGPVGSTGEPSRKGFDLFFGYNCQAVAHSYFPKYLWRNSEQVLINERPVPGAKKQPTGEVTIGDWQGEQYAPKLMMAEAETFIESNRERPFFLYLPFIEPHVAMHPLPDSVNRFPVEWDTEPYRGQCAYLPHPRPRAGYAAMISDLDCYVGRVMKALESAGVDGRTLVIFSSDNGTTHPGQPDTHFHIGGVDPQFFNSTAGLRGYKGSVYEGGMRVPMIARLPGRIIPNTVNDVPSYFADWFPTLCDAVGLDKPTGLDGDSLWLELTKAQSSNKTTREFSATRRPMIWVFPEYRGQVAVRIGDLKAVRQGLHAEIPGPWEVYNIEVDQAEKQDIASTQAAFIKQVEEVLRREILENKHFPMTIPDIGSH